MIYDLIIVGGGPAGVSAGIYAARKRLKTLLIAPSIGGQSTESVGVENWIGTVKISGVDLSKQMEAHLRAYAENYVDIQLGESAKKVSKSGATFTVETSLGHSLTGEANDTYESKTVLIATGSTRRKLDIPGAEKFENKGITYCASCDGPLFADADVVVIGGGNAGFESAAQLLAYAKSVTLLNRSGVLKADKATVEGVSAYSNMKIMINAEPLEIQGDNFVTSITYMDTVTGEENKIFCSGIFVEIGLIPTTSMVDGLVVLNENKQIPVDPKNQRTHVEGIWAAGDCTDGLFHQNNIASGDAVKALEDIYLYIQTKKIV